MKSKTIRLRLWMLLPAAVLLVLPVFLLGGDGDDLPAGQTLQQRLEFLDSYGWQVSDETVKTVTIPAVFNAVYENYNAIQRQQGFDLRTYAGQEALCCQYRVVNYPDYHAEVQATLLVFDGKIIGGDICSLALDGFMHGFAPPG